MKKASKKKAKATAKKKATKRQLVITTEDREWIGNRVDSMTRIATNEHFLDGDETETIQEAAKNETREFFAGRLEGAVSEAVRECIGAYFSSEAFRLLVESQVGTVIEDRFQALKGHFDKLIAEEITLRLKAA